MDKDSLECSATIILPTKDPDVLVKSLKPDNIKNLPSYLKIDCNGNDNNLICKILITECNDPKRIMTLKNTIDDILINIRSILDSLS